jgi:hypothetical protein
MTFTLEAFFSEYAPLVFYMAFVAHTIVGLLALIWNYKYSFLFFIAIEQKDGVLRFQDIISILFFRYISISACSASILGTLPQSMSSSASLIYS